MKILFYINRLYDGGAERAISNTASYFAEKGWDTILLTSYREDIEYSYSSKVRRMSIEDKQIEQSFLKRNISRMRAIRRICKEEKVDVVISFMREPNCRILLATFGLPIKRIISVRSDPDQEYKGSIGRIIKKYLLPHAEGAVFQTREAMSRFPVKFQVRSAVIYNVVDDNFYKAVYKNGSDIVTCGRICPEKNHALLVAAFKKVHDRFPDACLRIYGGENSDRNLVSLIEKLQLSDSVFFMGQCDDIINVLLNAKMFVLSSDYEGLPNALMEAMAVGVPSISTDCPCGGPRELFGKDLSDMLVPVGNVDMLADKMSELLANDCKRLEIGKMMKDRARSFRTDLIGEKWVKYVISVCER